MDALEHGNSVEETDEAVLRLGLPMAPSVLLQMVGPRVANHVLETMHEAVSRTASRSRRRSRTTRRATDETVVAGEQPRSVEEITDAVLEAIADEVRHMLDEGVVAEAADVDTASSSAPAGRSGWAASRSTSTRRASARGSRGDHSRSTRPHPPSSRGRSGDAALLDREGRLPDPVAAERPSRLQIGRDAKPAGSAHR